MDATQNTGTRLSPAQAEALRQLSNVGGSSRSVYRRNSKGMRVHSFAGATTYTYSDGTKSTQYDPSKTCRIQDEYEAAPRTVGVLLRLGMVSVVSEDTELGGVNDYVTITDAGLAAVEAC